MNEKKGVIVIGSSKESYDSGVKKCKKLGRVVPKHYKMACSLCEKLCYISKGTLTDAYAEARKDDKDGSEIKIICEKCLSPNKVIKDSPDNIRLGNNQMEELGNLFNNEDDD